MKNRGYDAESAGQENKEDRGGSIFSRIPPDIPGDDMLASAKSLLLL